jgi:hypothetical protein
VRRVLRASGKAVWAWQRVIAVDADPMQIQSWEGAESRCAETVLPNAKHYTMDE